MVSQKQKDNNEAKNQPNTLKIIDSDLFFPMDTGRVRPIFSTIYRISKSVATKIKSLLCLSSKGKNNGLGRDS